MKTKAYAKINLVLDVLDKREDNYHEVDFLMTTIDLYDEVELEVSDVDSIYVRNNKELNNTNNLAFKVLKLIKERFLIKNCYKITITKNILVAAGMAGGSSDAAAVLHLINKMENLNLNNKELARIGLELGSDIGFCVYSKLARVQGRGDYIELINTQIPKSSVLVINPIQLLSTKEVYENYDVQKVNRKDRMSIEQIIKLDNYDDFYKNLRNDLENTSSSLQPIIETIKDYILQNFKVTKVMVSGSGPTLLLFDNKQSLINIKKELKKNEQFSEYYIEIHKVL